MSDTSQPLDPQLPRTSAVRKVGIGAALVVLPLGAYGIYSAIENAGQDRKRDLERNFTYETAALRQVDPALIRYRQAGSFDTGLLNASALVVDADGTILAAGQNVIRRFSSNGAPLGDIAVEGTPTCLAVGPDGLVYAGVGGGVQVFDRDGKRVADWPNLGPKAYVTGLAVDEKQVLVADCGRLVVIRMDHQGKVLQELGKADPARGVPGLISPSPHIGVAIGADGLVWVSSPGRHRLEAYTPDGTMTRFWGEAGTSIGSFLGCCNPADFVMLADGSFITAEKGIPRIKRYLSDGRLESVVAAPSSFADNQKGVAIAADASGNVLALERGGKSIKVFSRIAEGT